MSDPALDKHKMIIDEWAINGFKRIEAYLSQFPETTRESASVGFIRILRNVKIQDYKADKLKGISKILSVTLEDQVIALQEIKEKALEDGKFADATNAMKEQNKLLALYEEDNKQKNILTGAEKVSLKFTKKT
tara:strand:+ start:44 stop:442 length:399 start_codon:yes stop_codon:yes gene_type:complete